MEKPITRIRAVMDYNDMVRYIEEKYNCRLRDYAAHKNGVKDTIRFNIDHSEKWKCSNFPRFAEFRKNPLPNNGLSKEGVEFYGTADGRRWFNEVDESYRAAADGECKELPYWDFWHHMTDSFEIHNGITCGINWVEFGDCGEEWQQEICKLFVKEFGAEDMDVEFYW